MLKKIKFKIKRLSIRWPVAFNFLISYFFIYFFKKKFMSHVAMRLNRFSFSEAFKIVFKEILQIGDPGKTCFRYVSLPVSSEINTPHTFTADSYLIFQWHNIFSVKRSFSKSFLNIRYVAFNYICLFAELLVKRGFYTLTYSIYEWLSRSKHDHARLLGLTGLLDISVLFFKWNLQLEQDKRQGLWFDLDQKGYEDEMSFLFNLGKENNIENIYNIITQINNQHLIAHLIFSEYLSSRSLFNDSYELLKKVNDIKNTPLVIRRLEHLNALVKKNYNNSQYILAHLIPIGEVNCFDVNFVKTITGEVSFIDRFNCVLSLNGDKVVTTTTQYQLNFDERVIASVSQAITFKGGIGFYNKNKDFFILESNVYNHSCFAMFNPLMYISDGHDCLIMKRDIVSYGSAFYIGGNGWNYYHWLAELVPLLILYKKNKLQVPIYFNFKLSSWHFETLKLLGLEHIEIIPLNKSGRFISFKELLFSPVDSKNNMSSIRSLQEVRKELSINSQITEGKRVFLKRRSRAGLRKSEGISDVEKLLIAQGFQVIEPSEMNLVEQIKFFSDVDVFIAEAGASFANIIFCPKNSRGLCLTSERSLHPSFSLLAKASEVQLQYAVSTARVIPSPYFLWNVPYVDSDIDLVKAWLKENCD